MSELRGWLEKREFNQEVDKIKIKMSVEKNMSAVTKLHNTSLQFPCYRTLEDFIVFSLE